MKQSQPSMVQFITFNEKPKNTSQVERKLHKTYILIPNKEDVVLETGSESNATRQLDNRSFVYVA